MSGTADLRSLPWRLRHSLLARAGSAARVQVVRATHRHCRVEFQGPVRLGPGFHLDIPGPGTLVVGPGVEFRRDFVCEISGSGRVTIGEGTSFTYGCIIQASTSVEIGRRCMFAAGVVIVDGSHRFRDPTQPVAAQGFDYRPIVIGDDVAVMAHSTVLNSIGRHSFVGANSVVSRPIPPYSLAVGSPARVIETYAPA